MGDTDNASKHSSNNSDSEDDFYDVNDDCHIIERDKTSWEDGEVLLVDEDDQKVAKKGQNWKNGPPEGDEEEGESGEGDEAGDVDGAGDGDEAGHGDENNEEEEEMDEKAAKKAEKKEKKKKKRQEMDTREVQVEVELKSGQVLVLLAPPALDVKNLKWKISSETDIAPRNQRLFYEGMELDEPQNKLSQYDIRLENGTVYRMKMHEVYSGIIQTYFLNEKYFDHKWTCSYEHIEKETKLHYRGEREYIRPLKCVRYGINVTGKYPDGDDWLGVKGIPSTDKEWPVAYHGTKEFNVMDILRDGLRLDKCLRFAYGKGIYCSPNPQVALQYGMHYHFDAPDGTRKHYMLVLQCRVDPARLQIVDNCHQYWLVPDGTAIRPYGVCAFLQQPPPQA